MRKTAIAAAAFAASMAMTIFCALAFANNVSAIVNWWRAFLAAGSETSNFAGNVGGFLPWLNWSVVDYSAVTTFIPFLGFLCISVSAFRLLRGKRIRSEDFPFFHGSDQLNIALGLFGTLWGIIVIGYFKLETVSMADLMQCLHTALFSTLAAVIWVFMLDRPLFRPLFARLLAGSGLAMDEDTDLADAVDRLISRLNSASDAFDSRQRAYESAFEKRCAEYEAISEKRRSDYEADFERRQKEYVEFFQRRIAELEKRAGVAESKLKAVAEALHG